MSRPRRQNMDRTGMFLSGLCLVHCLALPPLLAILPLLSVSQLPAWAHDTEWFHALLLVPVALVSGPVLFRAARLRPWIGLVAPVAFGCLIAALWFSETVLEQILTVFGAVLLFLCHWANLRETGLSR